MKRHNTGVVLCLCNNVSREDLENAVKGGARSYEDVQKVTRCSGSCGICEAIIRREVAELLSKNRVEARKPPKASQDCG